MKNRRIIKYIVIHCSATQSTATVDSIKRYWREVRGWKDVPGYHYLIKPSGMVIPLLEESKNSNGVYQHNSSCINIAYIGGIDKEGNAKDTRTKEQEDALFDLIVRLTETYKGAEVLGHRDFAGVKKDCPSFDVKTWLANYQPDLGLAA